MPKAIILCGVPTSGKSTWVKNNPGYTVISSDNIIEKYASTIKSSYNEVFDNYITMAIDLMIDELYHAVGSNKDIICDQTHLTVKSRKKKLKMIPDRYKKIAVYFELSEEEMLKRNRNEDRTKTVPQRVLLQMFESYKRPTIEEGFSMVHDGQFFKCPLEQLI